MAEPHRLLLNSQPELYVVAAETVLDCHVPVLRPAPLSGGRERVDAQPLPLGIEPLERAPFLPEVFEIESGVLRV